MSKKHLSLQPYFLKPGEKAVEQFHFKKVPSSIKDRTGREFFAMSAVEAPEGWSQTAIDVVASKYFRKTGTPTGSETSVIQLVDRVVDSITASGLAQQYFASADTAEVFKQELKYLMYSQRAAFNSPVWFNVGLWEKYKIVSQSEHFAWSDQDNKVNAIENLYERPQCSACFIQSIGDSVEGIFELAKTEAKLFKYGSGSGTNFSTLRSKYETTSQGGTSSGLISFLEVLDKGAGAIRSGGTTRRAAKMVVLDDDHPEVLEFIDWKFKEEQKAKALLAAGFSGGMDGEAYKTVSGQNANNSVRLSEKFMQTLLEKKDWELLARSSDQVLGRIPAEKLFGKIAETAWACAEPGLQFHGTINAWHTCPESGEIRASNPCSEYMFLDDSACNLASLNLVKFLGEDGVFDYAGLTHAVRILILAQEILVDYSSYPTLKIAQNSHDYRPLGLGYANVGGLLLRLALPYDSELARQFIATVTAVMTGTAYMTSAELSELKGSFSGFVKNKSAMLGVIAKHQLALRSIEPSKNFQCAAKVKHAMELNLKSGLEIAEQAWDQALAQGQITGYRNAQVTVIAPTGTIGLMMDCETTGIEPEFSLVRFKTLSGGGQLQFVNHAVLKALDVMGYTSAQAQEILDYIIQKNSVVGAPYLAESDYAVFDCANADSQGRFLSASGHLQMMAAAQPFLSGAISKTVNLPHTATVEDVKDVYLQAWKLGLKAVSIYRDGSKGVQPLISSSDLVKKSGNKEVLPAEEVFSDFRLLCPDCGTITELESGCYRCPNCGTTAGCS